MQQYKNKNLVFVYAGTIAEHYGIFKALEFIKILKAKVDNINLIIIGFAAQNKVYQKLDKLTQGFDYIKIIGGDRLVPHHQILIEMKKADFCLLPYQENKSTEGRIPTKLFECLAMEIPVITTPNPAWDSIIQKNNAGILYDFNSDYNRIFHNLQKIYYGNNLSSKYEWGNSSINLLKIIQRILY